MRFKSVNNETIYNFELKEGPGSPLTSDPPIFHTPVPNKVRD